MATEEEQAKALAKGMFLGLPRDEQLAFLAQTYKEQGFALYLYFVKIALNAPVTKGGIETEVLDELFQGFSAGGCETWLA